MKFTVLYLTPSNEKKIFLVRDATNKEVAQIVVENARYDVQKIIGIVEGDKTLVTCLNELNSDVRALIFNNVADLVSTFLYYDRKDDSELELGVIETNIRLDIITVNQIVEKFKDCLTKSITR